MFTQCPECNIAFRVTAKVLQQAAGNVRCGSCGHAFSALQYLSEEMPESSASVDPGQEDASVDELAETSRRLLETLDELAGPDDVRIEDTGVEWRVLDVAAAEDERLPPDEVPATEEMRFDDNTPLPEDFGIDDDDRPAAAPRRREEDVPAKTEELAERQGDLALSEPEDWTDILEEVSDPDAESLEVEEELAAIHNELNAIDDALTDEVMQLDKAEVEAVEEFDADQLEADLSAAADSDVPPEVAFGGDAEEPGDDFDDEETGTFEAADIDEIADDEEADDAAAVDSESSGEIDTQIDDIVLALTDDEPDEAPGDDAGDDSDEYETPQDEAIDDSGEYESPDDEDTEESDEADEAPVDQSAEEIVEEDEAGTAEDSDELAAAGTTEEVGEAGDVESTIEAEKEETTSEPFDQDDSFAATLVGMENPEELFDESSGEVETIIMEGEFIRSEIEQQRIDAENAARNQLDESSKLLDTYALQRDKLRGGRRSYDPPSSVVLGAIVALGLLFVGQLVHNFRQPLATYGFFNATVAPVYRMLGSPITPDWDIKGWQFEATNGSVDEEETTLTIVSRIVNRSDQALPYPLVHVSLTNRFEDIMGSRILEPAEYLAGDGDPSHPVSPGENFNAVITVEDPSVDATGFKLNVCYRVEQGTVRCAIEDFKN
jgi:predicted Zn finger-like uncharacterized protein